MKRLFWNQVESGEIIIKDKDREVVQQHFDDEIDLYYDDYYRIFSEADIYIADIESINKEF